MSRFTAPHVYRAISGITRAFSTNGIAKAHRNADSGYAFRGIDDIYNALGPLLAKHRLCLLPRILERGCDQHRTATGDIMFATWVKASFELRSAVDGSCHAIEIFGEAIDPGDKGTAKALSAAFKYAAMQVFCIPVTGSDDADRTTPPRLTETAVEAPPDEGWEAWVADLRATALSCESDKAIDRLQSCYRGRIRALSSAQPDLYAALGEELRGRRVELAAAARREAA